MEIISTKVLDQDLCYVLGVGGVGRMGQITRIYRY